MSESFNGPYQVNSSKQVYKNPWIIVREDRVTHPGGTAGVFGVVEMKPGSTVLAIDDCQQVYFVREFKYAMQVESLELMSGGLDQAESPLQAAQRELQEELGLRAKDWIDLGVINPFTTVVKSPNYMFMASDLTNAPKSPDDSEQLEVVKIPFPDALEMVMAGKISHAASCVCLLKAARLREHG